MTSPHTLTIAEGQSLGYKALAYRGEVHHQLHTYAVSSTRSWGDWNPGRCAIYQVSGQNKRWKRDLERFSVPVKFGMYGPSERIDNDEYPRSLFALPDHCPKCDEARKES